MMKSLFFIETMAAFLAVLLDMEAMSRSTFLSISSTHAALPPGPRAARIFSKRHIHRQRWSRDSSGLQTAGVRARRTFQGCLVNGRLINVLPLPLQTKGLECRRMPADLLQMEEIQSLNRILITGQRRVYTVEPFQLGHNTNKTEEGAGIASLCWALGIQCLAQTSSLETFCSSIYWCCSKLMLRSQTGGGDTECVYELLRWSSKDMQINTLNFLLQKTCTKHRSLCAFHLHHTCLTHLFTRFVFLVMILMFYCSLVHSKIFLSA